LLQTQETHFCDASSMMSGITSRYYPVTAWYLGIRVLPEGRVLELRSQQYWRRQTTNKFRIF